MTVSKKFRDDFIEWAQAQGCTISPYLSIKDSSVGGTGVFISLQDLDADNIDVNSRMEVMRIPKALTMSLDSFAENLLRPQQEFDASLNDNMLKQGDAVVRFMTAFSEAFEDEIDPYVKGGVSETNILVGQVQMLVILMKLRQVLVEKHEENSLLNESPFAKMDTYWKLLELTEVPALSVDQYYDKFLDVHKYTVREYRLRIERVKYDALYAAFDSLKLPIDYREIVNDDLLRRIELSVISRLLEVPEKIQNEAPELDEKGRYDNPQSTDPDCTIGSQDSSEDEDDGKGAENGTDEQEYGFSVSSTLVPIVDFVNHSNDYLNAFFDVDPDTGDVLLRVFNDKIVALAGSGKEEVELFIRYDDYEDALKFAYAYGFIPKSHTVQPLFEMPIDRQYLSEYIVKSEIDGVKYEHNLGLLLRWLNVQPNVQFILGYDSKGELLDVKMNLDENFIVFGFVKGLKYFREAALAIVKYYSEVQDDEYVEGLLELEESDENDVIGGYDVIPYSCIYVDEDVSLPDIVENIPDDEVDGLMLEFLKFFAEYAKFRKNILVNALESMSEGKDTSTVYAYSQLECDILDKYLTQFNSSTSDDANLELIFGSEDVDDEWLKQRLRPRTVPAEKRAELYARFATEGVEGLSI